MKKNHIFIYTYYLIIQICFFININCNIFCDSYHCNNNGISCTNTLNRKCHANCRPSIVNNNNGCYFCKNIVKYYQITSEQCEIKSKCDNKVVYESNECVDNCGNDYYELGDYCYKECPKNSVEITTSEYNKKCKCSNYYYNEIINGKNHSICLNSGENCPEEFISYIKYTKECLKKTCNSLGMKAKIELIGNRKIYRCTDYCDNNEFIYKKQEENSIIEYCVDTCPDGTKKYIENQIGKKQCIDCKSMNLYELDDECVTKCRSPKEYLNVANNICISSCPSDLYIYNEEEKKCVSTCSTVNGFYIKDETPKRCYKICPDNKYHNYGSNECIPSCTGNYKYHIEGEYICYTSCNDITPKDLNDYIYEKNNYICSYLQCYSFYSKINNVKKCFNSEEECKSNGYQYVNYFECLKKCSGYTIDNEEETELIKCFDDLDSCIAKTGYLYYNKDEKKCWEKCPNKYTSINKDGNKYECLEECPYYYYIDYITNIKYCLNSCKEQNLFFFKGEKQCYSQCEKQETATKKKYYFYDPSNNECLETCLGNKNEYAEEPINQAKECLFECPQSKHYFEDKKIILNDCLNFYYSSLNDKICVYSCDVNEYIDSNNKCVKKCPGNTPYFVENINNIGLDKCYSNCEEAGNQYKYIIEYNNQCVENCPDNYYSIDNYCYPYCPIGKRFFNTNNYTCSSKCPDELPYYETFSQNYPHIYKCKSNCNYYYLNNECKNECPKDYKYIGKNNVCVESCEWNENGPFYILEKQNPEYNIYKCVKSCLSTNNKFYDENTKECINNCPGYVKEDTNECVENCGTEKNSKYHFYDTEGITDNFYKINSCVLDCPSNKMIIQEDNHCNNKCKFDYSFIFNYICYESSCPMYTKITSYDSKNCVCDTNSILPFWYKENTINAKINYTCGLKECPDFKPYFLEENNECFNSCEEYNNYFSLRNKCIKKCDIYNTKENLEKHKCEFYNLEEAKNLEELKNYTSIQVVDLYNENEKPKGYLFHNENISLQIYAFEKNNKNRNLSIITNLTYIELEFDDKIYRANSLTEDEKIIIVKYDIKKPLNIYNNISYNYSLINPVEYEFYSSKTMNKIDLGIYEPYDIIISYPISYTINKFDDINKNGIYKNDIKYKFEIGKTLNKKNNEIDTFNISNKVYNDICTSIELNGADLVLEDRYKYLYPNDLILCENNCTLFYINYTQERIYCKCNYKTEFDFYRIHPLSNNTFNYKNRDDYREIIKCLFKLEIKNDILKNEAFWYCIIFVLIEIMLVCIAFSCGIRKLKNNISMRDNPVTDNEVINNIDNINDVSNPPPKRSNYLISTNTNLSSTERDLNSNNKKKTHKKIVFLDIINELIKEYEDKYENNKSDNNSKPLFFFSFLLDEIMDNIYCVKIFFIQKKYEIFAINLSLYLLCHMMLLSLLTVFFRIEIRKIFERKLEEIDYPNFGFYFYYGTISNIIIFIIYKIFQCILDNTKDINNITKENELNIKKKRENEFICKLIKKLIIYFIVLFGFIIIISFYLIIFCAIYNNTKPTIFKAYLISLIENLIIKIIYTICIVAIILTKITEKSIKKKN